VELTWDETDRERVERAARQFEGATEEGEDDDLRAYLASSSDDDDDKGEIVMGNMGGEMSHS